MATVQMATMARFFLGWLQRIQLQMATVATKATVQTAQVATVQGSSFSGGGG